MLLASIFVVSLLGSSNGLKKRGLETFFDLENCYELIKGIVSRAQLAADRGEAIEKFDDRTEVMMEELFTKVDELSKKLEFMDSYTPTKLDSLERIRKEITDSEEQMIMHEIMDSIKIVSEKHTELIRYLKMKNRPYKKFIKFLQDCVSSGRNGIDEKLVKIYKTIPGQRKLVDGRTVLSFLENAFIAKKNELCDEEPPQYLLYALYTLIATVEVTGLKTIVYCAKLLEKETSNNNTDLEIEMNIETTRKRLKDYNRSFRKSMKRVSRMFRTCDPDKSGHVRGETFVEMWGLIQVIVMWEYDFVERESCGSECKNMWGKRGNDAKCYNSRFESTGWAGHSPENLDICTTPRKCYGLIHSCQTIWNGNLCKLRNSTKRYDYFRDTYSKNKFYGQWSACAGGVYSSFDWDLYRVRECGMCMCVCNDDDDESYSVHIINLLEAESQYKSNRVVVGMRIREENRIIHLQIKEGKIGREYSIDETTVRWIPIEELPEGGGFRGIHYHSFEADHVFDMNQVVLDNSRVVIGARFATSETDEKHIKIQVLGIIYDPATGKLIPGTEKWVDSNEIHDSRTDVASRLPQTATSKTLKKSESNDYVGMEASDYDEDVGQTTLPLFDSQVVEMKPLSPWGGAGLHYRSADGHGGFIAISGHSMDYSESLGLYDDNDDE